MKKKLAAFSRCNQLLESVLVKGILHGPLGIWYCQASGLLLDPSQMACSMIGSQYLVTRAVILFTNALGKG